MLTDRGNRREKEHDDDVCVVEANKRVQAARAGNSVYVYGGSRVIQNRCKDKGVEDKSAQDVLCDRMRDQKTNQERQNTATEGAWRKRGVGIPIVGVVSSKAAAASISYTAPETRLAQREKGWCIADPPKKVVESSSSS